MSNGLSNDFVAKVCSKLFGKNFLGVFPCDIQPETRGLRRFSIIFNTGDSTTTGEHFVALYRENKKLFYFDSYGKKPEDKNVIEFINNQENKQLICWKKKIQHDKSIYCGFFCIAFLLYKYRKISNFCHIFSLKNTHLNNKKVVNFITKNLNK